MRSLRLAFRTLFKTPLVTSVAIISLALAIGVNGAVFSLFDQLLRRPLPVKEPDRLVNLAAPGPKPGTQNCNDAGHCQVVFSYPMFRDLEQASTAFSNVAAHLTFRANLAFAGQTVSGDAALVSGGYFQALGLEPALGRLLDRDDDRAVGGSHVAVLGHDYWRSRLGQRAGVLNEQLVVNGRSLAIVGVAPKGFRGTTLGYQPDVFVPITLRSEMTPDFGDFDNRRSYWAYLFARLGPGVTLEQARLAVNVTYRAILDEVEATIQVGMSESDLDRFRAREITLEPGARGQSVLHGRAQTPLVLLFVVTGLLLLIACANIANLLLARSAARIGEMAVRMSIGASRGRLILQLMTEAGLLGVLGAVAGLFVARWTLLSVGRILPGDAIGTYDLRLQLPVMAFAAVLALGTGLLFGLFPALHSTRLDFVSVLKGHGGHTLGTRAAKRFRASLVTTQIALSIVLLVSAGLASKSLAHASRVDLGVDLENLVTFEIAPERNGYDFARSTALVAQLAEELAALPGVAGVTASHLPLVAGRHWGTAVSLEELATDHDADRFAQYNQVGPGYFRTLGMPLLSGREFTLSDRIDMPRVAVINETFAKKFRLGRNPVGKRMSAYGSRDLDIEIVGLVRDAKYDEVKAEIPAVFYLPYNQDPDEWAGTFSFYVRMRRESETILTAIPTLMARLDPNLPIERLETMAQQVRERLYVDWALATLSVVFAALAVLLSAVGIYGVLAHTVTLRTRELGLRMALGADGRRLLRLVLRQVAKMVLVGGVLGLAAATAMGVLARSQLFEVEGDDPAVLIGSIVLLSLVAFAAGLLPAIRASRTSPMSALRHE